MNPVCPYCQGTSLRTTGNILYPHRPDLAERIFFWCPPCEAYVGTHAATGQPLGTLANATLRKLRNQAHAAFDPLWDKKAKAEMVRKGRARGRTPSYGMLVQQYRQEAYRLLAEAMEIEVERCHIAMFDAAQCRQAIEICHKTGLFPRF